MSAKTWSQRRLPLLLLVVLLTFGVIGLAVASGGLDPAGPTAAPPGPDAGTVAPSPSSSPRPARIYERGAPLVKSRPSPPAVKPDRNEARDDKLRELAQAVEEQAKEKPDRPAPPPPTPPTRFRVASFNVLGDSHTGPNGRHSRYADATTRMRWTVQLLTQLGISVAGFQEFQPSQHADFGRTAPGWRVFPGPAQGRSAMVNAVVWRADQWALVRSATTPIPYFGGNPRPMPYVLLRHLATGREVWFASFHNPADAHGPAQRWRDAATDREVRLANLLTVGGTPVVFTGDMNDREEYFCPMTTRTEMHAANGGSTALPCRPPAAMRVDWVFGSTPVQFSGYVANDTGLAARASDHPLVYTDATIAPRD